MLQMTLSLPVYEPCYDPSDQQYTHDNDEQHSKGREETVWTKAMYSYDNINNKIQ